MSKITFEHTPESAITDGFKALRATLHELAKLQVDVGVFEANAARDRDREYIGGKLTPIEPGSTTNNAEVGKHMEFGISSEGLDRIPARSFLREPLINHLEPLLATESPSENSLPLLPRTLAIKAKEVVKMAFDTRGYGNWAPDAPGTIAAKGRDDPGVDTGQLRDSIDSRVR